MNAAIPVVADARLARIALEETPVNYDLATLATKASDATFNWLQSTQGIRSLIINPLLIASRVTAETGKAACHAARSFFVAAQFAKPLIGIADIVSKTLNLFKTDSYSVFFRDDTGKTLHANMAEKGAQIAARICDWTISLFDTQNTLAALKFIDLKAGWIKTASAIMRFAAAFLSIYTIAHEAAKLYNGSVFNQELNHCTAMLPADQVYSILKIVSSGIYLIMAITGAGIALQITMASLTIAGHYVKHLALRPAVQNTLRDEFALNPVLELHG